MTGATIAITATVAAIAWMGWLFWSAPVGYEDQDGWHEGIEPDEHARDENLGV